MAKGLFLGFPGHGHVNPTIGLIKELIENGDEITYYCTEEFREKIESTGAKFIAYEAMSVEAATHKGNISSFHHLTSICTGLLEKLFETKEDNYDFMIYDSMINIGDRLGEILEIPHVIRSVTTFAFSKKLLMELTRSNMKMLLNFKSKDVNRRIKDMSKKYGIRFLRDFLRSLSYNKAHLNIVFTSRYFQPRIEDFNDRYKFVGPSIANRNDKIDFNINNPENKKVAFISLGTVANNNKKFYLESFKAFKDRKDMIFIMSVGSKTKIEDLGEIPSNFFVYNYVPQLELLKKVDIFITHGGMNSTSEGLYNNIPLIVVPQFGDQFIVGKRVDELKAGIHLTKKEISCECIERAFNEVLNNKEYKINASKIGESLREAGGFKTAYKEIHKLIDEKVKIK